MAAQGLAQDNQAAVAGRKTAGSGSGRVEMREVRLLMTSPD